MDTHSHAVLDVADALGLQLVNDPRPRPVTCEGALRLPAPAAGARDGE